MFRKFILPALVLAVMLASLAAYAASKKIVFFTVGRTPTAAEARKINTLKQYNATPYEIVVVNAKKYPSTAMTADYFAGSPPDGGAGVTTTAYYNVASPPAIAIPGGGSKTFVVPDGGI